MKIILDESILSEGATSGLKFKNYGDANFADTGRLVAKDGNGYYVITCNFDYDGKQWYITEDYIDIDDDWIDQEAIESYSGAKKAENPELFAVDVIDYYGTQNPGEALYADAKEGEEFLNGLDVEDEVYWDSSDFE